MPPKGTKRKEPGGGGAAAKQKASKKDAPLPPVGADSLAMPHLRELEKWYLVSKKIGQPMNRFVIWYLDILRTHPTCKAQLLWGEELRLGFGREAREQGQYNCSSWVSTIMFTFWFW